jgi:hypothetical protein
MENSKTELAEAISLLTLELREWRTNNNNTQTILYRMEIMERKIMSQITDWAATNQVSLDAISTSLDGITAGITALDTLITNFQNSPGTLSVADQAALDAIQASSKSLAAKASAIVTTAPVAPA